MIDPDFDYKDTDKKAKEYYDKKKNKKKMEMKKELNWKNNIITIIEKDDAKIELRNIIF